MKKMAALKKKILTNVAGGGSWERYVNFSYFCDCLDCGDFEGVRRTFDAGVSEGLIDKAYAKKYRYYYFKYTGKTL